MIKITPKSIAAILIGIALGFWIMSMMSCQRYQINGTITDIRGNLVEVDSNKTFLVARPDTLKLGNAISFKPTRNPNKVNCIKLYYGY